MNLNNLVKIQNSNIHGIGVFTNKKMKLHIPCARNNKIYDIQSKT